MVYSPHPGRLLTLRLIGVYSAKTVPAVHITAPQGSESDIGYLIKAVGRHAPSTVGKLCSTDNWREIEKIEETLCSHRV